jgi:hypothetical protein
MTTRFQRNQEIVMERLDDIPLLISRQQHLGLDNVIDEAINRHRLHQELSIGQLVIGWIAYFLSEGDRRKVAVEDWAVEHQDILSELLGTSLRRTDFTDDQLSQVLSYFAKEEAWQFIERHLLQNSLSVYRLIPERAVGLRSPWVKWEGVGGSSKLPYITLMPYGDIPCKKPHIDLTGEENKVY